MGLKLFTQKICRTGGALCDSATTYAESIQLGAKQSKMESAHELLQYTSQLAAQYGYTDTKTFIKDFKEEVQELMDF